MVELKRTNADDPHFIKLVQLLDADLAEKDGKDHSFYARFNTLVSIRYAIVAYHDKKPVGCGAMKSFASGTMEIKRMYTLPDWRGKGIASALLSALENWAKEIGCEKCVLETGKRQPEAIALYKKHGYSIIENYGQYAGVENSVCFEKML